MKRANGCLRALLIGWFGACAAWGQSPGRGAARPEWVPFDPPADTFRPSAIALRGLNESQAGEGGFIEARDGHFVHGKTGVPVRFWGVNGPSRDVDDAALELAGRTLAKRGVNLVRTHAPTFDESLEVRPDSVAKIQRMVRVMKASGIYTHVSVYFPMWHKPKGDDDVLAGYDGEKNSLAVLFFNPKLQERYRENWRRILTTPDPVTGKALVDEPAMFGLEIINEDSLFFWTFNYDAVPAPQMRLMEEAFGKWVVKKYGSLEKASAAWGGLAVPQDDFAAGRVGLRTLWNLGHDRTARDQDTATFMAESQRGFYADTVKYLRGLGFKGQITASNWITAEPAVLGPIERYTYLDGDFIDRHGYTDIKGSGEFRDWSIREGHTYRDRSALKFEAAEAGKQDFVHPVNDVQIAGKPSMLSETTWNRPNRYRTEAPMFYAAYGSLQDSGAIVHFALDDARWSVKPAFFMSPWTLMGPTQAGQFPAAALVFRKGLVAPGDVVAKWTMAESEMLGLQSKWPDRDALLHYVGRTTLTYDPAAKVSSAEVKDVDKWLDRAGSRVTSTNGQVSLDWKAGVLTVSAPGVASVTGNVKAAGGKVVAGPLTVASGMDLMSVTLVALDDKPLAESHSLLLQVMSEERPSDWKTESDGEGGWRILSIGRDPWQIRRISGTVTINLPGMAGVGGVAGGQVLALDLNGYPKKRLVAGGGGGGSEIALDPDVVYYHLTK